MSHATNLLDKAKRLFEFLAAVQRSREIPIRTTDKYEAVLWFSDFPENVTPGSPSGTESPDPEAQLIRVPRPPRMDPPVPAEEVSRWLEGDYEDSSSELSLREAVPAASIPQLRPRMTPDGLSDVLLLDDQPDIRENCLQYLSLWSTWATEHKKLKLGRDLYEKLFEIYQCVRSQGETFELVLGVGCLCWKPINHAPVKRHVMTFPVAVSLDQETGHLTIAREAAIQPVRVELDMLDISLLPKQMGEIQSKATQYNGHPLNRELMGLELSRFAHAIHAEGSYVDDDEATSPGSRLSLAFAPALILRRRSQRGLIDIYETIRSQLEELGDVPPGLVPLIDPNYQPEVVADDTPGGFVRIDDEIFMPMPVNDRQMQVIEAVNNRAQVVVQGPPGTGKTHTAAALISHLLAQGKRVLVTAQTERALHEVREKLPDEIRPLSVAVVGSSQSDMADLKVAVETISKRADDFDAEAALKDIAGHENQIGSLRKLRASAYTCLRESRQAETDQHVVGPYRGTLARIAEAINNDGEAFDWLQPLVDIEAGSASPLSNSEVLEWLEICTDSEVQVEEIACSRQLLSLANLPSPDEMSLWVESEKSAFAEAESRSNWRAHPMFRAVTALSELDRRSLRCHVEELEIALHDVETRKEDWIVDAVRDIRSGRRQVWQGRADQIIRLIGECQPYVTALGPLAHIWIVDSNLPMWATMARRLIEYFTEGGTLKIQMNGVPKIGPFSTRTIKEAEPFFTAVKVDGLPATSIEKVTSFLNYAEGSMRLDRLDSAWPASVFIPEEDTLDERLQWHIAELNQLMIVLNLADRLAETEEWLRSHGLKVPNWSDIDDLRNYTGVVDAVAAEKALDAAREPLDALMVMLKSRDTWLQGSQGIGAICRAIKERDIGNYRQGYQRLHSLHEVRVKIGRRDQLGDRFGSQATRLQQSVIADLMNPCWPERLARFEEAWHWAAAKQWLLEREYVDVNALQEEITGIEAQIRREVEGLTAGRAWQHALSGKRMTRAARSYLTQYVQRVRRLGKGTGVYASQQRQEIREALDQCRSTVPVWIMPIFRIAEQLRIQGNMFDVVLIDEASQAGLEAAFLQFIAPRIIVIGDDKQVSPAAVGVNEQQLRDLACQYLDDNHFRASWQDPKRSYFDEAVMRFGGKITLIEHRRCVPEIIGFSNRIAYEPDNTRLLPVRQRTVDALSPIRTVHVADGYEWGRQNPAEAEALVDHLVKCTTDAAYDGKSFGVISLMGKDQAKLIQSMLLEVLPADEWARRDLRCGDAADFQGSERDVVFLSMVKAATPGTRITSLTREMYLQRYNVAASRARDQMWLFHSLLLSDLGNPDDMRFALLDYMINTELREQQVDHRIQKSLVSESAKVAPFDSLFEQRVFNRIYERGYSVIPQFPAEGYIIDLVVVGSNGNLAIECDGDYWHGPEHYAKDLARQRELERCGWNFFRVRESAYYLDPAAALSGLWSQLEELSGSGEGFHHGESSVSSDRVSGLAREPITASDADFIQSEQHSKYPAQIEIARSAFSERGHEAQHIEERMSNGSQNQRGLMMDCSADLIQVEVPMGGVPALLPGESMGQQCMDHPEEVALGNIHTQPTEYREFHGSVRPTSDATDVQIMEGLIEIVKIEGPVMGERLFTAYVRAGGGRRVGTQIARDLHRALTRAVARGYVIEDNPLGDPDVKGRTYRLPDQPEVWLRSLGPRALGDVPPMELATRVRQVRERFGLSEQVEDEHRAVLDSLGLKRWTDNAESILRRAGELVKDGSWMTL